MNAEAPLAGIPRRIAAYLIDIAVAFIVVLAIQGVLYPVNPLLGAVATPSGVMLHAWVTLTVSVPIILYLGLFWASASGATPGMRLLKVHVRSVAAGRVPTARALLRAFGLLLPFELNHAVMFYPQPIWGSEATGFRVGFLAVYALLFMYLTVTVRTPLRQGPHDLAARSVVRRNALLLALLVGVGAGCTAADDDGAPVADESPAEDISPNAALLTADGWGPLRIGMSRAEVVLAAGEDANPNAVGGPDPESCDEFRPRDAPEGILVMIENGVLTRISVSRNSDIATPAGIRVGDPVSAVLTAYGSRADVQPHKYWEPPASYVTVWRETSADAGRRGIRYEINVDEEVVHLRGGGPSIEYVEGCL